MTTISFGSWLPPYPLIDQRADSHILVDLNVPYRNVGYRSAKRTNGRTVTLSGEIRVANIADIQTQIAMMRRLADGTIRSLTLEDGTTMYAILTDVNYTLDTTLWPSQVPYSVTFLETESPD